ncbi:NADH-quinone oxidoreductase subunit L [Frankliniella fusca]|uniref:NADH-quinone oxidoreductase subunit L n=1 Tax=Frankliniella fusca TaxID=407009 RepID=A0AAE1LAA5_9NEOP|nr:NADH-quinone oxidoreductase subunit L [Frankliniella fusca]
MKISPGPTRCFSSHISTSVSPEINIPSVSLTSLSPNWSSSSVPCSPPEAGVCKTQLDGGSMPTIFTSI